MVEGVETFVEEHYEGQIRYVVAHNEACRKGLSPPTSLEDLSPSSSSSSSSSSVHHNPHPELLRFLRKCQADEVHHREDAHHNLLNLKYTPINPVSPKTTDSTEATTTTTTTTPPTTPSGPQQKFLNAWAWLIDAGSRGAAKIAKRI
eukprot:CAMPEP_0201511600 /NCGR_PEP_ID=MMETSP0161_2-20130828/4023_1 /ASSEMBLY_ACC=CAM_ASM_000251 /TAXON_ID=180227 /ORGANISM="Neoparamoeba aestuarina, Strain SoJaBio B1-5/56/2" /LENGTH=146 /DNA_ID=CAMNT_0047907149 /DNA_START=136 /DNA_END=576 /DNA_ORIENTATION=-